MKKNIHNNMKKKKQKNKNKKTKTKTKTKQNKIAKGEWSQRIQR